MTIEELKKDNENLANQSMILLEGQARLELQINDLKLQIQKLKCCSNCKHYSMKFLPYFCIKNQTSPHCTKCCDKWELSD